MKALRFAILGKSQLAVERLQAIEESESARIVRSFSAAQVARFKKTDWGNLLDPKHIDAVVIALPAEAAASAARNALLSGIHVLSELPGGLTVEDIINLREAETRSGAILKFGCSLRYHESVRAAEDLLRTEPYGRLLTARAVYGHAGFPGPDARAHGILLGHGVHMLDLLHVFFGPFESVKAMAPEGPDGQANLFALLKGGSGAIAQLHTSATSWRHTFRLELGYERGYVWLDGHLPGLDAYGPEMLIHAQLSRDEAGAPVPNPEETVTEYRHVDFARQELEEFLQAIRGEALVRHGTSRHAFDAMNIAQRICAAVETWA